MSKIVIKVENLTKFYRLGVINYGTLAKDLQAWWAKIRGKENPNSQISSTSFRGDDLSSDSIYALKDLSFEVAQGEVLGIIGANGAGKSTLLKILSRVASPTGGSVKIRGKIGSLLEIGTGFHPELTGRENIYLNGAILGMKKWEINKKLDEIIDFSGIEKFIDTPVKRYSSGMYVRLAFAVAAHLDPEILIVDEVLAVGDAEFQKKCIGKMDKVSKKEGRTVLFVSHNMASIRLLCDRGILLKEGEIEFEHADINLVINRYLEKKNGQIGTVWENKKNEYENPYFKPLKMELLGEEGGELPEILDAGSGYTVRFSFEVKQIVSGLYFDLCFYRGETELFTAAPCEFIENFAVKRGITTMDCKITGNILNNATYRVELRAFIYPGIKILTHENAPSIFIPIDVKNFFRRPFSGDSRLLHPIFSWERTNG